MSMYLHRNRFLCRCLIVGMFALVCGYAFDVSPAFASDAMFTKPIESLTSYRERPLFAPNRRATISASAPEPVLQSPSSEPLNAVLLGVVSASDGTGLAVLRIEGEGEAKKLRIGEAINGWQLDRVESHAAIFSSGEQNITLTFPAINPGEPVEGQNGAGEMPSSSNVPVTPIPKQIINP